MSVTKDKKFEVLNEWSQIEPLDTKSVCDLVKNPDDNQQYVISL